VVVAWRLPGCAVCTRRHLSGRCAPTTPAYQLPPLTVFTRGVKHTATCDISRPRPGAFWRKGHDRARLAPEGVPGRGPRGRRRTFRVHWRRMAAGFRRGQRRVGSGRGGGGPERVPRARDAGDGVDRRASVALLGRIRGAGEGGWIRRLGPIELLPGETREIELRWASVPVQRRRIRINGWNVDLELPA
jgi:hypothetical protein